MSGTPALGQKSPKDMNEPTNTMAPTTCEPAAAPSTQDAVAVLLADHRRIEALLADVARVAANDGAGHADRSGTVSRLGALLKAHVRMEAELLHAAVSDSERPVGHVTQARHGELLDSLHALSAAEGADDAAYGEALTRLQQSVRLHIVTQEKELVPQLQASPVDLLELGTQMSLRRAKLLGDQGVD